MAGPIVRWPVAADKLSGTRDSTRPRRLRRTAAILACLVAAASCTPQPPSDPPPSPATTAPPATPTPSPKPSPTPTSERERALAESKQTYIDFWKAQERLYQAGGGNKLPKYIADYLVPDGPAEEVFRIGAKSFKDGRYSRQGKAVLRAFRVLDLTDLSTGIPAAKWQVCVDQTGVVTKSRGKVVETAAFIDEQVSLQFSSRLGRWRVYSIESRTVDQLHECKGR